MKSDSSLVASFVRGNFRNSAAVSIFSSVYQSLTSILEQIKRQAPLLPLNLKIFHFYRFLKS